MTRSLVCVLCVGLCMSPASWQGRAQEKKVEKKPEEKKVEKKPAQTPTFAKVPYGKHQRQLSLCLEAISSY